MRRPDFHLAGPQRFAPDAGGHADGDAAKVARGAAGPARGVGSDGGPRFDGAVPPHGYAWWYVDALSDDGQHGITLIGFIGSVFSPFYAWSRRHGTGEPQHYCALNAVLYGKGGKRWAMTERGRGALQAGAQRLDIGPSAMTWDGDALTVEIDEVAVPLPTRIRGTVRVHPAALTGQGFTLDAAGRHGWSPIAPVSRVEVALSSPSLSWSGPGYLDTNSGSAALEDDFVYWDWCRAPTASGATILYNASRRVGGEQALALRVARDGGLERMEPPPLAPLPRTLWRMEQHTRADAGHMPRLRQRLEDTPFYARSVIETRLYGETATAVHESLSLDRFRAPWVQVMLPFRIPRRW